MPGKFAKREQARELARAGISYNQITKQLNVAKSSVSNWCRDIIHELSPEQLSEKLKRDRQVNVEKRDEARRLYMANTNTKVIAGQLGVHPGTVVRWCKDLTRPKSEKIKTQKIRESKAPFAEIPYSDCRLYHYTTKDDRRFVNLVNHKTGFKVAISLARYLMSVKEGRILEKEEIVRHREGLDDVLENLYITTFAQERLDHIEKSKKPCAHCKEIFSPKKPSQSFCSMKCRGIAARGVNFISRDNVKTVPCKNCHKPFKQKSDNEDVCSRKCRGELMTKIRLAKPKPIFTINCVVCEEDFQTPNKKLEVCSSPECRTVIQTLK